MEIPEFGWAVADGVNPLRLITRGAVYNAGGVAPGTAPTLAAGTRATSTLECGVADIGNGDQLQITDHLGTLHVATFVSAGSFPTPAGAGANGLYVALAGTIDATLERLRQAVQAEGVNGVFYSDGVLHSQGVPWGELIDVECPQAVNTTDHSLLFRVRSFGAHGNSYEPQINTDTANGFTTGLGAGFFDTAGGGSFTTGANGSGTAPRAGTYRYFTTWYRSADDAETGPSPVATVTSTAPGNITLSGLTGSADTTFDFIRIYRTAKSGVEFYLTKTVGSGITSTGDTTEDAVLVTGVPYNTLLFRVHGEGMPPRGRALALWKGAIWTLGAHLHAEYSTGTVTITDASTTVTFSVKGVSKFMVGMTLRVAALSESYTILSVDEAGPTCVIDRAHVGGASAAAFTIRDDYDASRLRRCVPFKYNQWPVDESPGRVETDDIEGGTALLATQSRLYGFSRTSIVAVTGDGPESWEISKVAEGVGCVAPRMVVGIGEGGIFLSSDGFYAIGPDETVTPISSPKTRPGKKARGIDGTVARIAWANIDQGYAYYDAELRLIVFGVPLDDALVPNYEIVFDLQNSTWALYQRAAWTAMTRVVLPGGGQATVSLDRDGNLWHVHIGESDGFYGTEAVQTLTGAQTVRVLTVTGTPFSTNEAGKPVVVLYANGSTVALGKVAASTTSTLTLAEDLATAPAAGDQIVLGGIAWQWKSGNATLGEEFRRKWLKSVTVRHAPSTRGDYFLSYAVDGGSLSLPPVGTGIGSLAEADGKIRHFIQHPGDAHALSIRGFKPGGRAILRGLVLEVGMREVGR